MQALTTSLPNYASAGLPLIAALLGAGQLVSLIGQAGGGTALFLTGLILSAQKVRLSTSVNIQTLAADVVHPLLAAGLAWAFAVSPLTMREAIVLSALPVGFFGILFGLRFGIASEVVSSTLIASTVLSDATLAAAIYLTAGMG